MDSKELEQAAATDLYELPPLCLFNDQKFYLSERFYNFFQKVPGQAKKFFLPEVIERRKQRHQQQGIVSDEFGVVMAGDLEPTDQERIDMALPVRNTARSKIIFGDSFTGNEIREFARKSFEYAMEGNDKYAKLVWETAMGRPEETLAVTHTVNITEQLKLAAERRRQIAAAEIDAEYMVLEDAGTADQEIRG